MKTKDRFLAVVEAVIWYCFIYYLIYAIKNPVELWQSALVLLILAYLGTILCPWMQNSDAWKRMLGKKE
jgi:multisubunit Na+/H+ antiporter MnhF subunit